MNPTETSLNIYIADTMSLISLERKLMREVYAFRFFYYFFLPGKTARCLPSEHFPCISCDSSNFYICSPVRMLLKKLTKFPHTCACSNDVRVVNSFPDKSTCYLESRVLKVRNQSIRNFSNTHS